MSLAELLPALHELPMEEKQRALEFLSNELAQDNQRAVPSHPKAGIWKDLPGFWMAPDFDAPLEDFKEYME